MARSENKYKIRNTKQHVCGGTDLKSIVDELPIYAFIDGKKHMSTTDRKILDPLPLLKYDETKWKKLFPNENLSSENWKKLQMTEVGTYSIGQPDMSKELIEFVKEQIFQYGNNLSDKKIVITETNGGLGGFSLALLNEFDTINIVELNPTHYSIIKNNLTMYGYTNKNEKKITIYEADYLNKMLSLEQDIIICDPPWGGKNYINNQHMKLGISNIDITYIINILGFRNKFKIFIFLAPKNFDFNSFMRGIDVQYFKTISIKKVRRHNYVAVISRSDKQQ